MNALDVNLSWPNFPLNKILQYSFPLISYEAS